MLDRFIKNPEIKRNIWLDFSLNRMVLMPLFTYLLFYVVFIYFDKSTPYNEVFNLSIILFVIIVYLWGTRQASECIIAEVNNRTWDAQRLTLLSPWQMTIGKLFGSTLYQWYGGVLCLLSFVVASFYLPGTILRLKMGIMLILIGVFVHSIAITLSLMTIKKDRSKKVTGNAFNFIISLLIASHLVGMLIQVLSHKDKTIGWYSFEINVSTFSLVSVAFFTFWAVIGVYRNIRSEFMLHNGPWVWLAFMLSIMIYFAGIDMESSSNILIQRWYVALAVCVVLIYFMAFRESKYIVDIKHLIYHIKQGEWKKLINNSPLWLLSFMVAMLISLVIVVIYPFTDGVVKVFDIGKSNLFFSIHVMLFVIRDLSIMLYLNLSEKRKRADTVMLLYLFLLYGILPFFFRLPFSIAPYMLYPYPDSPILFGLIPAVAQVVGMMFLLERRFKKVLKS